MGLPESTRSTWIRWGFAGLLLILPILLFGRLMGNQMAISSAESQLRPLADLVVHFQSFGERLPRDREEFVRVERPNEKLRTLPQGWGYRFLDRDVFVVYLYGPDGDDDRGEKAFRPWDLLFRDGDVFMRCDGTGRVLKKSYE